MRLAPYPKYKPSGVEWLGDVPAHWEVKRIKSIATYRVSNVDKVAVNDEVQIRLVNYTDVYHHDYIGPDMGLMETTATLEEVGRFSLRPGDVVITKDSEDWRDIAVPALVVESGPDLVCGYHLGILRPKKPNLLGSFLFRALQTSTVNQQFRVAATGVTRYGLPKAETEVAWLPLPSPQEQRAIADFLDREAAKIDTLIEKKQTLIERLKEKRTALITRTVTRGLPPEAARAAGLEPEPKMRASGVEWLGDVPAHWKMMKLKKLASLVEEKISEVDGENRLPYIGLEHIESWTGVLCVRDSAFVPTSVSNRFRSGDILFGKLRPYLAKACKPGFEGICSSELLVLRPRSRVEGRFLLHLLLTKGFVSLVDSSTYGAKMPRANWNDVSSCVLPVSPLKEQRAIADFLDRETAKIDGLVAKVETAIARLREYRAALITAAVTGQVDVRG